MEKTIADALGITPQKLFPERYSEDGLPHRAMGRKPIRPAVTAVRITTNPEPRHAQNIVQGMCSFNAEMACHLCHLEKL